MPANQLSVSFSYTYSSELQAVKSAISVIQLYILQNFRPLASSFWKQCAFVCWSLLHLWVAQSGSQYMPCPCKKERGKVRAEVTCMHIDSGCCICCLYFLWPNYCLVSGRKGFSCVATGGHALFELSLQENFYNGWKKIKVVYLTESYGGQSRKYLEVPKVPSGTKI